MNRALQIGPALPPSEFARIRRRAIFDCCKWDPQVEDVSTLAPFPLLIDAGEWRRISELAAALARETLAAEAELCARPDLLSDLGIGRRLRAAFRLVPAIKPSPGAVRVMRFDFHLTRDGWRISEANTDVPGGFNEASGFTNLMARYCSSGVPTGDPAQSYADAILRATFPGAVIALVHATAYTDDRQVMVYLARHLKARSLQTRLAGPAHLQWDTGRAIVALDAPAAADFVVRFFPAEWLPNLGRMCAWQQFFRTARTPLSNPATALAAQSKRFPIVWDRLSCNLRTWRTLLPETHDPREVPWRSADDWILKPTWGRTGDSVGMRGVTTEKDWKTISRRARWFPGSWIAQRRFDAVPIQSEHDVFYPCIGVYTIDGKVAGAYGRLAARPLIDWRAQDAAVLVTKTSQASCEVATCN